MWTYALIGSAMAATWQVPADAATVADALALAASGDTVHLAPGALSESIEVTIDLTLEGHVDTVWSGVSGAPPVVIDGSAVTLRDMTLDGVEQGRVLEVRGGATAVLEGVTITRGSFDGDGAGVYVSGASDLTVRDSTFTANVTGGHGGHLYTVDSEVHIERSIFERGSASGDGGAVKIVDAGAVSIVDSWFVDNSTGDDGGGVSLDGVVDASVSRAFFCRNDADDHGGGLEAQQSHVRVEGSLFVSNVARTGGGMSGYGGSLSTAGVHLVGNSAAVEGSAADLDLLGSHVNMLVAYNTGPEPTGHALWNRYVNPVDYVLFYDNYGLDTSSVVLTYMSFDPGLVEWPTEGCEPAAMVLSGDSQAVDAGVPAVADLDGSPSDVGAFGGPSAFRLDVDLDGWLTEDDCHDGDASIYPGAVELPGDEVDQDCDGTELCFEDADGDGRGESAVLASADGDCHDPGEALSDDDICPGFDDGADADGDGVPDGCEPVFTTEPTTTEPTTTDRDGDGVPDAIDPIPDSAGSDGAGVAPHPDYGFGCATTHNPRGWLRSLARLR